MTAPDSNTSSTSLTPALHELKTQIEQATQAINPISNVINQFHKDMAKGEQDLHPEIQKLYDEMHARHIVHQTEMKNIDFLVDRFDNQGIYEGLEDTIKPEMIDAIVQQRVAVELENHMSKKLLKELDEIYSEIERVKLELHNSENRRQNSFLKFGGTTRVVLNPIKKADGNGKPWHC
ncbi:hypothetical protein AX14_003936 [Amanita brunnescens Koide BX004]|nr:hypothetical protein AX14_003936 [Amanita brunnescens Koide BX004]